jgi:hypothetical protein
MGRSRELGKGAVVKLLLEKRGCKTVGGKKIERISSL